MDLRWEILQHTMDQEMVEIEVLRANQTHSTYRIAGELLANKPVDQDILLALGFVLFRPSIPAVVGIVQADSAAARAGFLAGGVLHGPRRVAASHYRAYRRLHVAPGPPVLPADEPL